MSSAWRRWLVLAGAVGVGGALLFARRAPEEGSRAEARPASGPGAAASRAGVASRASTPPGHVEAASSPSEPAVPREKSPGAEAPRSPADASAGASASPPGETLPGETLEEMEAREARERAAFAASLKTLPPMEYAKPPGPESPPPSTDIQADPVAVQRLNQERLLQKTRAAVEGFTQDIQKEEGKLRRAEESGAPEELLARYRAKLELLRQGEAKFRAKVRLLESELGR